MINSKQKGKRGEREWRDKLREQGFKGAHRGQQFKGTPDSPDVVCPELPNIHFEIKFSQQFNAYQSIYQARQDAGYNMTPVVAWRKNDHKWLVIMEAEEWFKMVKDAGYALPSECPHCHASNFKKNGLDSKTFQRYLCINCHKSF